MNTNPVPPDGIKLHIGGQVKCEGWTVLDVLPGPFVDYVGNCNDLSFLGDECCSEIYASHVLEHLDYKTELQNSINGIYRALKPGGRLRVSVPDLDVLCRLFLHPKLDGVGRFLVMRMMFGGRESDYDTHYVGLNFDFLREYLKNAGFVDIHRVKNFGLFKDTSSFLFGGMPISLNIQARKPDHQ